MNHGGNLVYNVLYKCVEIFNQDLKQIDENIIISIKNNFHFLKMKDHLSINKNETFFLDSNFVLRTHTTGFQYKIFTELNTNKNINQKNIYGYYTLGKVYRKDDSSRHNYCFHQIDGLIFLNNLNADIFYFLEYLKEKINKILGRTLKYRIRCSYFPFTKPSYEIDLYDSTKNIYMEILGCGFTHHDISSPYTNSTVFAFGMGIERLALIKYKYDNIKKLIQS